MSKFEFPSRRSIVHGGLALAVLCLLSSCARPESNQLQGYVEGEFIYIGSALPGTLLAVQVQRGAQVKIGDPLFSLESASESTARDEAERRLAQARANLEDVRKGKRSSELESIEATVKQAKSALELSETELARQEKLGKSAGATAEQERDRARATRDQNRARVAQFEADLETARLGARPDQIAAAEANVRAMEATLTRAESDLSKKQKTAPKAGLIFDTLFREGEWVAAGRPVVVLLPPENIKVRAFVPESRIGRVQVGHRVEVTVDGVAEPLLGKISFISPRTEFTPPVIFSRESRSKLVFMIEIAFDPEVAAKLHPGQPLDIRLGE
jgi:HlyD family secretion protein